MKTKSKDNPYVRYVLDTEERLLYASFKENGQIGLEEAKSIIEDRLALQDKNKRYVLLIDSDRNGPLKMTKEARDYFAQQEKGIIAHAICANSTFEKMMASIYMTFSNPIVPAKLFTNQQKAIDWLKKMRDKEDENLNRKTGFS